MTGDDDTPLFRDHERPLPERVNDLVGRPTAPEKVRLRRQFQPAVDRLGVEAFFTAPPSRVRDEATS